MRSLLATLLVAFPLAAADPLPPAAVKAKAEFDRAVAKAQGDLEEKITAARKELDKKVEEARQAYLKTLGEVLVEEAKKANLDGANAVKAEKDRLAAAKDLDKKLAEAQFAFQKSLEQILTEEKKGAAVAKKDTPAGGDKAITLAPKLTTEKAIKEAFDLEGDWRIEKDGLRLFTQASMTTAHALTGDFTLNLTCGTQVATPDHFWVEVAACGEAFAIRASGTYTVKLERKGDKLTFRTGPGQPQVLTIKDANKDVDFKVRLKCVQAGPFSGKSELFVKSVSVTGHASGK